MTPQWLATALITLVVVVTSGIPAPAATATEGTLVPSTPLLSARRVPGLVGDALARQRLQAAIGELISQSVPQTCAVVADGSGTLVSTAAEQPLVPASTLKLATAAVAAEVLGADYRWTTTVSVGEPVIDGVVAGPLYLVGGGDPLLATSGFAQSLPGGAARVVSPLEQLADALVASGVRRVDGGVVGVDGRFDTQRAVPSWSASYLQGSTVGSLGALRVNRGLTQWVDAPERPGMRGDAGDPALLAAATFATLLRQRGVDIAAGGSAGSIPSGVENLASLQSPPLLDVVLEILAWSDNGAAELVLKELGLIGVGQPSTGAGAAVVTERLAAWGLPMEGFVMVDGSGLDTGNRVTCTLLVELMRWIADIPDLASRLAVAGEAGTLTGRLGAPVTSGWVLGKTGSLFGVTSLAGVTLGSDARPILFAWVANGQRGDAGLTTDLPDAFATGLRSFPDVPELPDLGPRPAVTREATGF